MIPEKPHTLDSFIAELEKLRTRLGGHVLVVSVDSWPMQPKAKPVYVTKETMSLSGPRFTKLRGRSCVCVRSYRWPRQRRDEP